MSHTTTLTIRVDKATRDALDKVARSAQRSKSFMAAEVLDAFVKRHAWYEAKIKAAHKSRLLSDDEVETLFEKLDS